jgi:hypothetical protein
MNYEELLSKYRTKEVFIYGRSVIQLTDMETYLDSQVLKTDFIFHTDRNRQGVISIVHDDPLANDPIASDSVWQ